MATDEAGRRGELPGFTPGPWRWELNRKAKIMTLRGARSIVMDFDRYGMQSAAPRFLVRRPSGMEVMERADSFAAVIPKREHHADWCAAIDHPDANLIAAAPDLFTCLEALLTSLEAQRGWAGMPDDQVEPMVRRAREAIAKATGEGGTDG